MNSKKKIAIIFDDLIQKGGAESLLLATLEIFPEADLYTSVISDTWKKRLRHRKVFVSFMQKLPFAVRLNRFYSTLFLHSLAFSTFNLNEYALVLSISSRYAHHVVTKPTTKHICYINSPGRMFWEPFDYFDSYNPFIKFFSQFSLSILRMVDFYAAQRVDEFIANSKTPQKRVSKYFQRDASIIYPFIDISSYADVQAFNGNYFLIISRLQPWKKIDIAIKACEELKLPLKIVGEGPDLNRLKNLSTTDTTQFLGYVSDSEKLKLLSNCTALINTQLEDFGIVPLEALASGKPVIAYGYGGVLETVKSGHTGEFFYEQTPEALKKVLHTFDPMRYDSTNCVNGVHMFDVNIFREKIKNYISDALNKNNI